MLADRVSVSEYGAYDVSLLSLPIPSVPATVPGRKTRPQMSDTYRQRSVSVIGTPTIQTYSALWNGPVCATCCRTYIGEHTCRVQDLEAQIELLRARIAEIKG